MEPQIMKTSEELEMTGKGCAGQGRWAAHSENVHQAQACRHYEVSDPQ